MPSLKTHLEIVVVELLLFVFLFFVFFVFSFSFLKHQVVSMMLLVDDDEILGIVLARN